MGQIHHWHLEHILSQGEVVYEEKLLTCGEQRGRAERVDAATQSRNEG